MRLRLHLGYFQLHGWFKIKIIIYQIMYKRSDLEAQLPPGIFTQITDELDGLDTVRKNHRGGKLMRRLHGEGVDTREEMAAHVTAYWDAQDAIEENEP